MSKREPRRFKRPSGFGVEVARTGELLGRWLSLEFDRFFDLSVHGGGYRGLRTLVLALVLCLPAFVIHLILAVNPILTQAASMQLPELITTGLITAGRIGLVMGLAIVFGLQVSADFLSDIFEIKDGRVAAEFIARQTTGGATEVLHLREGKIAEDDLNSPVVLIGGPGLVIAESDTAALFEHPDGTPHVIGPRGGDGNYGAVRLSGFERLREPVVSLRDQYIGSLGGAPMTVVSRSMDGMPISAVDVRGMYSLRRSAPAEAAEAGARQPYPLDPKALEDLIYKQTVPVLTEGPYASGEPGSWNGVMQELIHTALAKFMSQNKMGEYVAGVGDKENELSEFREDTILSQTLRLSKEVPQAGRRDEAPRAAFHPRTELTARLLAEDQEFARRARSLGLELQWIGVGTWKMPDEDSGEAVKQKHLEAWRIHRETAERADPRALETLSEDAEVDEKLRLIREVPIASHQQNQARYKDKDVLVECLLQDFWQQMGDALSACYETGPLSGEQKILEKAVANLEDLLKIRQLGYLVGGGTMSRVKPKRAGPIPEAPPAPASQGEAEKYAALLGKLGGDYRAAEGMIANEGKRRPAMNRRELIERILLRFERYGR